MSDDRNPREVSKLLDSVVAKKAGESWRSLVSLGLLAGVYVGFGAVGYTTALSYGDLPVAAAKFLGASVFCVGLILVIIPGSELFTGNILMATGLVDGSVKFSRVMRNWVYVYLGNFLGSVLLAFAIYHSGLMGTVAEPSSLGTKAAAISAGKLALPFGQAFIRGILCNMLVCLAVILALASKRVSGKILGIYFPVMVFVLSGYEHSIANMYLIPAGLMMKGEFVAKFFPMFENLIPVTLGNILGGLLVILLHPARGRQVRQTIAAPTRDNDK